MGITNETKQEKYRRNILARSNESNCCLARFFCYGAIALCLITLCSCAAKSADEYASETVSSSPSVSISPPSGLPFGKVYSPPYTIDPIFEEKPVDIDWDTFGGTWEITEDFGYRGLVIHDEEAPSPYELGMIIEWSDEGIFIGDESVITDFGEVTSRRTGNRISWAVSISELFMYDMEKMRYPSDMGFQDDTWYVEAALKDTDTDASIHFYIRGENELILSYNVHHYYLATRLQ